MSNGKVESFNIKTINDISLVVSICKIKGTGPDFSLRAVTQTLIRLCKDFSYHGILSFCSLGIFMYATVYMRMWI